MRAVVTGAGGFVGTHLVPHLQSQGDEVLALPHAVDIADGPGVRAAIAEAEPDAVYHLAGWAHVGASFDAPLEVYRVNTLGTAAVIEACSAMARRPRVLVVGSADAYGAFADDELPLREETPLRPLSPYGASKAAAEAICLQAHRARGLEVVLTRSFNHTGPGQAPTFVVPALAARIAAARRSGTTKVPVGNLAARRDLLDVEDVVRAYRLLVVGGEPGRAYNVCSGTARSVRELAERLCSLAGGGIDLEVDQKLVRPVDVPVVLGDPSALRADTGWEPQVPLDETLARVLAAA